MKQRLLPALAALAVLAASPTAVAQEWREGSRGAVAANLASIPSEFRAVSFDVRALTDRLEAAKTGALSLTLPLPEGGGMEIVAREASVMHPDLQARYPEIRTYTLSGARASGRLAVTPLGVDALVFTPRGVVSIMPSRPGDDAHAVFYMRDVPLPADLEEDVDAHGARRSFGDDPGEPPAIGDDLKTYRIAVAATGELTQAAGGTVAAGQAAVVVAVNRMNGVFERDLSVTFRLIAGNDALIFTNPDTDPYDPSDRGGGGVHFPANRQVLNSRIGEANYDVGHVLGPFDQGGGAATGAICLDYVPPQDGGLGASKADGFSRYIATDPATFATFYHEMGHLSGAPHTWVTRNLTDADHNTGGVEPSVGYSIMSYGQFASALRPPGEARGDFFHAESIRLMNTYLRDGGGTDCGTTTATGNEAPVVTLAEESYTIPANTPFVLTGSASDGSGTTLTYTWEQMDQYGDGTGAVPLFRTFDPRESPTRHFPDPLVDYFDETLPTGAETYHFRLTARDNVAGHGGVGAADLTLTTDASVGPLVVTFAENGGEQFVFGERQTVTWRVERTRRLAANVDILFSTDGGQTFPITLAEGVPNDGSHEVDFPVQTTEGRVMVKASGNVFYNLSGTFEVLLYPVAAVSPTEVRVDVRANDTAEETVSIANTVGSDGIDLEWTARVANAAPPSGEPPADACSAGQTVEHAESGSSGMSAGGGAQVHGQSFTAPCTGVLRSVALLHYRNDFAGEAWSGTLDVYLADGDVFTLGEPLSSSAVSGVNPSGNEYMLLPLERPMVVEAGQSYAFFLTVTEGRTRFHEFAGFAGGSLYAVTSETPPRAVAQTTRDLTFRATLDEPQGFLSLSEYEGSVAPGEAGALGLTFDPAGYAPGRYTADVVIATNDIDRPEVVVSVTMRVQSSAPTFSVEPRNVRVVLGESESETRTLTFGNTSPEGFDDLEWSLRVTDAEGPSGEPPADGCRVDQSVGQPNRGPSAIPAGNGAQVHGQSFTAPCTGVLRRVELMHAGSDLTGQEWSGTLRVYAGGEGTLNLEEPLYAGDVSGVNPADGEYLELPAGLAVQAGERYAFFLEVTEGQTRYAENNGGYNGGTLYAVDPDNPARAFAQTSRDATFRLTFGEPEGFVRPQTYSGTIAPGETAEVELVFDADGYSRGRYRARLVLTTNAENETKDINVVMIVTTAVVQEDSDAGDLPSTAQDAVGAMTIRGTLGSSTGPAVRDKRAIADAIVAKGGETADCYEIGVTDPASFTASTVGDGTTADTDLLLFTTEGEAIAAQDDADGTLQSRLPAEALNGRSSGFYVLCVTASLTDPVNAAGEEIIPVQNENYAALRFPTAPSGDFVVAAFPPINPQFGGAYVVDLAGIGVPVASEESPQETPGPDEFALGAPAPNPARGTVRVPFALASASHARLAVYDALGREVAVLASGQHRAGTHEAALNARTLAPGVYVVHLVAGEVSATRRITVVR